MRKIAINILAEDFSGVKLEANGSMMVSDKDYQYFLEEPGDMLYHYSETKPTVNKICKDAFAKVGIAIDDTDDLREIKEYYYSEDGKERSFGMTRFRRPKAERGKGQGNYFGDDDKNRAVQNELYKLIDEENDKLSQNK